MKWLLIAVCALFAVMAPATARDNGQYAQSSPEVRRWVEGLTDKRGRGCCSTADGYPAEAEWDTEGGHYRVRINGDWYVVPEEALVDGPQQDRPRHGLVLHRQWRADDPLFHSWS